MGHEFRLDRKEKKVSLGVNSKWGEWAFFLRRIQP